MKKIIRLTESDLARIVKRVIMEQPVTSTPPTNPRIGLPPTNPAASGAKPTTKPVASGAKPTTQPTTSVKLIPTDVWNALFKYLSQTKSGVKKGVGPKTKEEFYYAGQWVIWRNQKRNSGYLISVGSGSSIKLFKLGEKFRLDWGSLGYTKIISKDGQTIPLQSIIPGINDHVSGKGKIPPPNKVGSGGTTTQPKPTGTTKPPTTGTTKPKPTGTTKPPTTGTTKPPTTGGGGPKPTGIDKVKELEQGSVAAKIKG